MICFELSWSLGKANDDSIHSTCNSAHQNAREDQPSHESKTRTSGTDRIGARGVVKPTSRAIFIERKPNGSADQTDTQTKEEEDIAHEIIGNNRFPTTVLEESEDILSCLDVTVPVKSNVNKCPLVEVSKDTVA